MLKRLFLVFLTVILFNIGTTASARETLSGGAVQNLTAGTVQKYIYKGMAQDEVVLALGSPNIVTQDANGKETWVYDKMSSVQTGGDRNRIERVFSFSELFRNIFSGLKTLFTLGLLDEKGLVNVSCVETSQSTLTIVIKFDESNKVESFSYHSSRF